ncbi:MAG: septum formation initiator family protein [Acidimicrobiia bacterium]|nr:septum formation initiator family protein [Acidimicrobiia bacterium]
MAEATRERAPAAQVALISLAIVALLFLFVFPTRTYLEHRSRLDAARSRLALLQEESARLEEEAARLQEDEEIERIARDRYNLVMPGEEAFAVVPAPPSTTTTIAPPAPGGPAGGADGPAPPPEG